MEKILTIKGYDIYMGKDSDGTLFYNAVKQGAKPPNAGYYSFNQLMKLKNIERRKHERKSTV